MTQLSTFFKGSGTGLGSVFYPSHFVVATFPTYESAKKASQSLREAGFLQNEMSTATASEILEFFKEYRKDEGAWGDVMRTLSRYIFGSEAKFADADIERAKAGSGFVAVRCSTQGESMRIGQIVKPFSPLSIQWYRSLVVETVA
jgi:hypothetical protein